MALPGPSARSIPGSGRASRQSDFSSDRIGLGTLLAQSSNAATDHVIERWVLNVSQLLSGKLMYPVQFTYTSVVRRPDRRGARAL